MNKFTKKDLFFSVMTGLVTGIIGWQVFHFLHKDALYGVPVVGLVLIVPVLWILGVNLGYFLGRWMPFFNQFGRYVAVGFTNFAVDNGVMYLLIALVGLSGSSVFFVTPYTVFKAISFLCAVVLSYVWNRNWVFGAVKNPEMKKEFLKFIMVNIGAIIVNIAIATVVFSFIKPQFGFTQEAWAGIGSIAGSACALLLNFVGFRTSVFPPQT